MFLIEQLYLLQNVLPHFGEAGSSLLPTPQHQTVLIVPSADPIQGFPHGLYRKKHIIRCFGWYENKNPQRDGRSNTFSSCWQPVNLVYLIPGTRIQMTTHNTAVLFIVHFLHLQAVRLKDTRSSHCYSADWWWTCRFTSEVLSPYQIFKLHIQVLADGELCVGYGLVEVCVQIVEHLCDKMWPVRGLIWSQTHRTCHVMRSIHDRHTT